MNSKTAVDTAAAQPSGRPPMVQAWIDAYQNDRKRRGDKPHADCRFCGDPHDKHLICGSTFGFARIGGQNVSIDRSNCDYMQQFVAKKPAGFHWRDDIYFNREPEGVRITRIEFFNGIHPGWQSWLIPNAEWKSIVDSVAAATPVAQPSAEPVAWIERRYLLEMQERGAHPDDRLWPVRSGRSPWTPAAKWAEFVPLAVAPAGAGEPTEPSADATRLAFLNSRDGHLYDMLRSITYSSLEGYRSWIDRGMSRAGAGEQPSEAPEPHRVAHISIYSDGGVVSMGTDEQYRRMAQECEHATPATAVGGEPSEKRDCDTCKHEGTGNNECRNCYQRINWKARDE